jgi:hypothetical protein
MLKGTAGDNSPRSGVEPLPAITTAAGGVLASVVEVCKLGGAMKGSKRVGASANV